MHTSETMPRLFPWATKLVSNAIYRKNIGASCRLKEKQGIFPFHMFFWMCWVYTATSILSNWQLDAWGQSSEQRFSIDLEVSACAVLKTTGTRQDCLRTESYSKMYTKTRAYMRRLLRQEGSSAKTVMEDQQGGGYSWSASERSVRAECSQRIKTTWVQEASMQTKREESQSGN